MVVNGLLNISYHLQNAMSPPHVVGLANGFAQSLVSFGRFVGPVIGGLVSIAGLAP